MMLNRALVAVWLIERFGMETIDDFTISSYAHDPGRKKPTLADELDDPYRGAIKIEFPFNRVRRCVVFKAAFAHKFKE